MTYIILYIIILKNYSMSMHIHTQACTYAYTRAHTLMHTRTYTHTHTHTHTYTHTHTHTHNAHVYTSIHHCKVIFVFSVYMELQDVSLGQAFDLQNGQIEAKGGVV